MSKQLIEFWFDFSSAYAYFAADEIEHIAAKHQKTVLWRPFMLGAAFKVTGSKGLSSTPLKRDYALYDWSRIAKLKGIPFRLPHFHPTTALPATRAYYHLEQQTYEGAVRFAKAVFTRYYAGNFDTGDAKAVASMAGELGFDEADVFSAMSNSMIKEKTREVCEDAVARGVFGSPWFFVGSEPFWGWDRLPMLDQWLAAGSSTANH